MLSKGVVENPLLSLVWISKALQHRRAASHWRTDEHKDLATLVLLVVVVLVVVHLWFGSHASTNLQPFAGFPNGIRPG
jgi:hypothetical protein